MKKYELLKRAVQTEVFAMNAEVYGLDELLFSIIEQVGLNESIEQSSEKLGSQIYDLIAGWVIGDVER